MKSSFSASRFLALMSLAVACSSAVATGQDRSAHQAEQEELVWSKLLSTIAGERYQLIVVQDSADLLLADAHDRQLVLDHLTGLREETVESFARANTVARALPQFTALGLAVAHAGAEDLAPFRGAADPDEYWRRFYERYPDSPGLVRLSRVGFDQASEQALVFVYHICGGRCGTGKYVLLSRSGKQWEVVGERGVFVR